MGREGERQPGESEDLPEHKQDGKARSRLEHDATRVSAAFSFWSIQ
jgi:hypothetical protein